MLCNSGVTHHLCLHHHQVWLTPVGSHSYVRSGSGRPLLIRCQPIRYVTAPRPPSLLPSESCRGRQCSGGCCGSPTSVTLLWKIHEAVTVTATVEWRRPVAQLLMHEAAAKNVMSGRQINALLGHICPCRVYTLRLKSLGLRGCCYPHPDSIPDLVGIHFLLCYVLQLDMTHCMSPEMLDWHQYINLFGVSSVGHHLVVT